MASFNLGPHPVMMSVLDKYDIKAKVPLTEFIEALRMRDLGYSWRDLIPNDVPYVAWYVLYDAYLEDEERNDGWKTERITELAEAGTADPHEGNVSHFTD